MTFSFFFHKNSTFNRAISLLIFLKFFLFSNLLAAQENKVHFSSWNNINLNLELEKNLSLKNEIKFRRTNFIETWQQFLIRPAILYSIKPDIQLGLGVTYSKNYQSFELDIPIDNSEKNIWQQILFKQRFENFMIFHRFRLEERFKENIIEDGGSYLVKGYNYKNRLRYRFTIKIPLGNKRIFEYIALRFKEEILMNINKSFVPKTLDENRLFLGYDIQISEKMTLSSGYLYSYSFDSLKDSQTSNNILETTLKYTL